MKKIIPFFTVLIFSCGQGSQKNDEQIFTKMNDSLEKESISVYQSDELLIDEYHVQIYAHPNVDEKSIGDIRLKFMTTVWFDDYPVKPVSKNTALAPINYRSHKIAREYKTVITRQYESGTVNFAGHYIFTSWGCGSPCEGSAIIDVLNGKVYEGPMSGSGFQTQKDSRMVLANPPDSAGFYEPYPDCCYPSIYIFNERKKEFEHLDVHEYK